MPVVRMHGKSYFSLRSPSGVDGNGTSFLMHCDEATDDRKIVTLEALLYLPAAERPSLAQRYRIALAVASSYLQLHSSAWLATRWCEEDKICVIDGGTPLLDQPHLKEA